jgi:hypothetical protein
MTINAGKYKLYLPNTEPIVDEIEERKREFDGQKQYPGKSINPWREMYLISKHGTLP